MHYFSEKPESAHKEITIEGILRNKKLTFKTDTGIFSPKKIDKGTKILVEALKLNKNYDVLDIGCGYGVVGIAIADEVNSITMTDINKRAVRLAKENIKLNDTSKDKNIRVVQGDLYENVKDKNYDMIISNPPIKAGKETIHRIIKEGKELLKDNGSIWLVIQTKHGAKSLTKFMEEVFGNVEVVTIKGGYRVLMSKNDKKG
ncbi:class I SAM-dependent methyltransferase [Methanothermococcus okinawensis]|uniref:Methyltransferase small n=1 Tax=Methanothermococcus okinawensis (strain DSM 14208 / JCM 11175 / IH1) TaxID=647113 RepID=F8ALA2_METOI|nr:class I SAM-dependent methyltransferase [Methanothermococcus okinawensis]AEH06831.1 methyltransferase small [Methanothermococcus okinawensis IH1]